MIVPTFNLERQADALARAQQHWQSEQHSESAGRSKAAWTVAITREAGANGSEVAHEVGEKLNWTVYDRELVERIAQEMGLRSNLLDCVDEKQKSWFEECVESLTSAGPVSDAKYVKHLVETVLSLSALGKCVIVGRGGVHMLPANRTLRVRIIADRSDRIKNIQRKKNLSEADAAHWVDQTDRDRVRFVKEHFHRDPADLLAYDLVLNTSRWSNTDCADIILTALKKLESRN